ncbi:MAG: signal peptide peptidase SppA [Planctomycetota bacterium]|nr:signal peptide peptidase SppA [Planctomycetota bacterium]
MKTISIGRCLCLAAMVLFFVASAAAAQTSRVSTKKVSLTTQAAGRSRIGVIRLSGRVLASPPGFVIFGDMSSANTLQYWLRRLARARNDKHLAAVALEIDSPSMSWAQAQELADAVRRLDTVKPVYSHVVSADTAQYLVASAGRKLAMNPTGTVMITGLAAELLFYRGTLEKIGVEPQIIQIGRFKGAAEPFTQDQPSQEFHEMYNWILDDLYEQLCGQIASQRKLQISDVRKALDAGPLSAKQAHRRALADSLIAKADWRKHVARRVAPGKAAPIWLENYGRKRKRQMDLSNPFALMQILLRGAEKEKVRDPAIAIVHADGVIVAGRSRNGLFGQQLVGAGTLAKTFKQVANDGRIKAVIFRINSPGGSAQASELIYQAVKRCAAKKPVVASISQTGASGGYYIAAGAPTIVADPAAITGSIGVVSGKFALTGLLGKIGVTRHEITRGKNAGLWMLRPWTLREQTVVRKLARQTYDTFVRRVATSRKNKIRNLSAVTQGRIFTARQAADNGLIDSVGGLHQAVQIAKKKAGIDKAFFITLPPPRTLMDMLTGDSDVSVPDTSQMVPAGLLSAIARRTGIAYLLNLAELLDAEVVLTAMPYVLRLH